MKGLERHAYGTLVLSSSLEQGLFVFLNISLSDLVHAPWAWNFLTQTHIKYNKTEIKTQIVVTGVS